MLLSAAIDVFLEAKYGVTAAANIQWYKPRLASLLSSLTDVEVDTITTADLRRWRKSLVDKKQRWDNHPHRPTEPGGLSPHTIRGYIRACRAFFNWLEGEGIVVKNPARRLEQVPKPQDPPKDISQEDALKILEAAKRGGNVRDYAILRFLADTGCRVSGIGLAPDGKGGLMMYNLHLQPDEKGRYRALVKEKGRGGKRKARHVYFNGETASVLAEYLEQRPDVDHDYVFISQQRGRFNPLGTAGIHRMISRYAKPLGITGQWNPHAWRHAFAHGFLKGGGELTALSQLMGHSGIGVTADAYSIWADAELAEWHAKCSWLNGYNDDDDNGDEDDDDEDTAEDPLSPVL